MMTLHDLPDAGFADADAAMTAVRRLKLRDKLRAANASIARALEHLDVVSQPDRGAAPAGADQRLDLTIGGCERDLGKVGVFDRDGKRMRERELLEGADAVLEFLDLLAGDVCHGVFSFMPAPDAAGSIAASQSLCRGAEKTPREADAGGAR
ncbi:hypothetical protein ACLBKU_16890 [Erythrobacter sp. NE805]|uniref:hypothetical protein n=1 Tax=Erythrobacter sp. NE805 TaxID=3389875 RepID=UPI00396AFEE4